jgi:hypothetical protein
MTKDEFEAHCAELDRMAKPKRKPTKRQMRWIECVLGLVEADKTEVFDGKGLA